MTLTLTENKNLVCRLCELYIVDRDEIKDLARQPLLNGNLIYSMCPLCGQSAIDPKDSKWRNKIDDCLTSLQFAAT